jgi:F0F1-type ATP synthase membrane subunit b/b'
MMRYRIPIAAVILAIALLPGHAMAAEGAAEGGSWVALLFFVINFSIFIFILARFAGPMAGKFFKDRSSQIRGTLARATATFQEAQDLANRAAKLTAGLEAEKARLAKDFEDETAIQAHTIVELARAGAERIARDAELTAAALADSAQRRVRNRLAAAATQIAHDLIVRDFNDADQARLLAGFMDKLRHEVRP